MSLPDFLHSLLFIQDCVAIVLVISRSVLCIYFYGMIIVEHEWDVKLCAA